MATKKTRKPKQPRLTLHYLLATLSFWGSSVRLLLITFLVGVIYVLKLMYADSSVEWETKVTIYILGSFALLDIGYVMLAKALPLKRRVDTACLLLVEALLAVIYIVPNLVEAPGLSWFSNWTILIVLLTVAIRALLGLLFASPKKRA